MMIVYDQEAYYVLDTSSMQRSCDRQRRKTQGLRSAGSLRHTEVVLFNESAPWLCLIHGHISTERKRGITNFTLSATTFGWHRTSFLRRTRASMQAFFEYLPRLGATSDIS
jgi:hypothetical protein